MRSFTIVLAGSARCSTSSPFYPVRSPAAALPSPA